MSNADRIRSQIAEGVMAGVRDAAANLFKVANGGDHGCRERARVGIGNVRDTANMMLELIDEVFEDCT